MGAVADMHNPGFVRNWAIPATGTAVPVGLNITTYPGLPGVTWSVTPIDSMTSLSLTFDVAAGSTAVGTFNIQVSDFGDNERPGYDPAPYASTFPWANLLLPNGSTTPITVPIVSGAQTINLQLPLLSSQWLRLTYTATSGTGTLNVAITGRANSRT